MLDICLLGTAGMMPSPNRYLTSLMIRYNGSNILIDSGEGTQIALQKTGWSPNPIDVILITHFHADHISGLPGMLLSMANADRHKPVLLVGPKGLEHIVKSLLVIAKGLPFELRFHEIDTLTDVINVPGYTINAFRVNHNVVCYGYSVEVSRQGRFDVEKAKELNIPLPYWNKLQHGDSVTIDGVIYEPRMVLGEPRRGLKVTYVTDTRPCKAIVDAACGSDLFVCEGMYGEKDKADLAKEKKHMTFYEAARLAKDAKVDQMWLTHFSPSLMNPKRYMSDVKKIFPNAHLGKNGKMCELNYKEEDDE